MEFMPQQPPPSGRRFFTLEQANSMLPLIRRIVADIGKTARRYERVQTKLRQKGTKVLSAPQRPVVEAELFDHADRLEECLQELRGLGVEFKGWDGLVDFPAWVEGREIEYCWKQGEAEVNHWHEIYTGYAHRKPLPVTSPITPELVLGDPDVEELMPKDVQKPVGKRKTKSNRTAARRSEDLFN
jgi:hypothetical protein